MRAPEKAASSALLTRHSLPAAHLALLQVSEASALRSEVDTVGNASPLNTHTDFCSLLKPL